MENRGHAVREEELLAQLGWIRGLALRLASDAHVADDIVQEALLHAMERPPQQKSGPGLRAWLARVTGTLARQAARGEQRRRRRQARFAAEHPESTADDVVERTALQQRLVRLVMELEEPQRTTLLLRHVDGLDSKQIARRLDMTPAAVRKRNSRTLERLRARLDEEYGGDGRAFALALAPLFAEPAGSSAAGAGALVPSASMLAMGAAALVVLGAAAGLVFHAATHFDTEEPGARSAAEIASEDRRPTRTPQHKEPGQARQPASVEEPRTTEVARQAVFVATRPQAPALQSAEASPTDAGREFLHGFVRDRGDRPLAGAEVRLVHEDYRAPEFVLELWGPQAHAAPTVECDAKGYFELPAEEPGAWRLWAGAPRMRWRASELLQLEPGRTCEPLVFWLDALPAGNLFEGRVVTTDGEPIEGAILEMASDDQPDMPTEYARSGSDGGFVIAMPDDNAFRLRALDPDGIYAPTIRTGLRAGGGPLTIELRHGRRQRLFVRDVKGAPLPRFFYALTVEGDVSPLVSETRDAFLGEAIITLPDRAYTVRVGAEGYRSRTLGPFPPLGGKLEVELTAFARLSGTLHFQGRALAGAVVQLTPTLEPGVSRELYGFAVRLDGQRLEGTTSDALGHFSLPIREPGSYSLFGEAPGYAAAEIEHLNLGALDDESLDIELSLGGAIAGRVTRKSGLPATHVTLRFGRGYLRVRRVLTDEAGRYRIERLTPGPWKVMVGTEAPRPRTGGGVRLRLDAASDSGSQAWNARVHEGGETRLDLVLED